MRARLPGPHRSQYPDPVRFRREVVGLGARDEEWPAFARVTCGQRRAGWAPVDWLQPLDDGRARALHDDDARELDADDGDTVTLHHEHGGWWWSERADGAQGRLPARTLELLDGNTR